MSGGLLRLRVKCSGCGELRGAVLYSKEKGGAEKTKIKSALIEKKEKPLQMWVVYRYEVYRVHTMKKQ